MAKRSKQIPSFTEQLRREIKASGLSQYRISVEAELPREILSRFVAGKSGMSLASVDKIVEVLGLRLVKDEAARSKE